MRRLVLHSAPRAAGFRLRAVTRYYCTVRVLVKHAAGLNRRAALLRSGVRAAPSPAAVALADGLLNTLGAGTAAGRA